MFPRGGAFTFRVLAYRKDGVGGSSRLGFRLEGRCPGVVRLNIPPKAAYFEGRCRGVVRLSFLPKAAYFEGRCRGVVPVRVPTKED